MKSFNVNKYLEKEDGKIYLNLSCCRYKIVELSGVSVGWEITKTTDDEDDSWTVFWMDKSSCSKRVMKLKDYQYINHYPCMDLIARKVKLTQSIGKMSSRFPKDYDFYPLSFELPREMKKFFYYVNPKKDITFLIKPNAESCSRGIILSKNVEIVKEHKQSIVQMYIDNPILIENKKFDLRVYCLVLSVSPLIMYMFQDGLVRICTENYQKPTPENIENKCMHFTNYTLNKKNVGKFKPVVKGNYSIGNKRDFNFLRNWLTQMGQNHSSVFKSIEDVLIKTLIAIQPHLEKKFLRCMTDEKKVAAFTCFEILGFDILLDENYKPHLLEVNHSPSYNIDTMIDKEIKLKLISETFLLLGIDAHERRRTLIRQKLQSRYRITGSEEILQQINNFKQFSKEKKIADRINAEKKYIKNYKKIYPVEDSSRFDHLFQTQSDFEFVF